MLYWFFMFLCNSSFFCVFHLLFCIFDFPLVNKLTKRVRKDFEIPHEVSKSLTIFMQRTIFPRLGVLCFNQRTIRDCQRKDTFFSII